MNLTSTNEYEEMFKADLPASEHLSDLKHMVQGVLKNISQYLMNLIQIVENHALHEDCGECAEEHEKAVDELVLRG